MTDELIDRVIDVFREQPPGLAYLVAGLAQVLDDMGEVSTLNALRRQVFARLGMVHSTPAWERRFARAVSIAQTYGVVEHDGGAFWWVGGHKDAEIRLADADTYELAAA